MRNGLIRYQWKTAILLLMVSASLCDTIYVSSVSEDDDQDCGFFIMNPCRSIQVAVEHAADNDTVMLMSSGVPFNDTGVSVVNKTLTLSGESNGTVWMCEYPSSSLNFERAAYFQNSSITLQNIKFVGCKYNSTTSGIASGGTLLFEDCPSVNISNSWFVNSSVISESAMCSATAGGAIAFSGEQISITNCIYEQCSIESHCATSSPDSFGGAIQIQSFSATIMDTVFTSCNIESNSGAALIPANGGALRVKVMGSFAMQRCIFLENKIIGYQEEKIQTPGGSGGAAYIEANNNATIQIVDCKFHGNYVMAGNSGTASGGAIFVTNTSTVEILGCLFNNNSVSGGKSVTTQAGGIAEGGALYAFEAHTFQISNTQFESNFAAGGVNLRESGGISYGGAILLNSISHVKFQNVSSLADGSSGGIGERYGGNAAGGSIAILEIESIELKDVTILNCTTQGGAGFFLGGNAIGIFYVNSPGGSLLADTVNVSGNNVSAGNTWEAGIEGEATGGLYLLRLKSANISNSIFQQNSAITRRQSASGTANSAAMYVRGPTVLQLSQINMTDNQSGSCNSDGTPQNAFGGSLMIDNVTATIFNLTIENSLVCAVKTSKGGGIYIKKSITKWTGGGIYNCRAANGGAFYLNNSTLWLENAYVSNNTALAMNYAGNCDENSNYGTQTDYGSMGCGGAVYLEKLCNVTFLNAVFHNNTAQLGGVFFFAVNSTFTSKYCNYNENQGLLGGGVLYYNGDGCIALPAPTNNYSSNVAPYGPGVATNPQQLYLLENDGLIDESNSTYFWPGESIDIQTALYDFCANRVIRCDFREHVAYDSSILVNTGNTSFISPTGDGIYHFYGTIKVIPPSSSVVGFSIGNYSIYVTLQFVTCPPGQWYYEDFQICIRCESQTFLFGPGNSSSCCEKCPPTESEMVNSCFNIVAEEPYSFTIDEGYQANEIVNPTFILACPNPKQCLATSCIANATQGDDWYIVCNCSSSSTGCCAEGYTNRLCSQCVCNDSNCYYAMGDYLCEECNYAVGVVVTWSVIVLVSLVIYVLEPQSASVIYALELIVTFFFFFFGLADISELFVVVGILLLGIISQEHLSHGIIGIFIYYAQSLAIIPVSAWPEIIGSKFHAMWDFRFLPLACFFSALSNPVASLIVEILLPFVFILMVTLLISFAYFLQKNEKFRQWKENKLLQIRNLCSRIRCCSRQLDQAEDGESDDVLAVSNTRQDLKCQLFRAWLFFIDYSLFKLSFVAFSVFPSEDDYMTNYLWIPANFDNGEYIWLFTVALVVICFISLYFILISIMLWKYRELIKQEKKEEELQEPYIHEEPHIQDEIRHENGTTAKWLGTIYKHFRIEYYWFYLLVTLRRLVLSLFSSGFLMHSVYRPALILGTFIVSAGVVAFTNPYEKNIENKLDILASSLLAWSFGLGEFAVPFVTKAIAAQYFAIVMDVLFLLAVMMAMVLPHVSTRIIKIIAKAWNRATQLCVNCANGIRLHRPRPDSDDDAFDPLIG